MRYEVVVSNRIKSCIVSISNTEKDLSLCIRCLKNETFAFADDL